MPKNSQAIEIKPKNSQVLDVKPQLAKLAGEFTQSYQVVISANQYMGLPFLLTYRDTGTMTQFSEKGFDH